MTEITDADRKAAAAFKDSVFVHPDILARAFAAHRELGAQQELEAIVVWLREENSLCDCHARSESECACGAWEDYKTKPLLNIADDIASGAHRLSEKEG